MNIFLKSLVVGLKILVSAVLILVLFNSFYVPNLTNRIILAFFFFFITLVTLFIFFFKDKFLTQRPQFKKLWKAVLVIYLICLALLAFSIIWGTSDRLRQSKTQKAVDFINSQKITLFDVFGNNLPPKPDQAQNDSTISGIDTNHNFVRDDVELAIYQRYPNSAKIRSAMLQYAQALQLELTQVVDSGTLVATIRKESRGMNCVAETGPEISLKDPHEKILAGLAVGDDRQKEIDDLVLNTDLRKKKQSDVFEKYMTTYSIPATDQECDIDSLTLPN